MNSHTSSNGFGPTRQKVDIIWNMTLVCPWNCGECCVDAVHVYRRNGSVVLASEGLSQEDVLPADGSFRSVFEQALYFRQKKGLELDVEKKRRVLDNLSGYSPKIDFSGGDAMVVAENFQLMNEASERFGRKNITLTATGAGLATYDVSQIAPIIGELNFTYDNVHARGNGTRPAGYAIGNLRNAAMFAASGVKTRAECPLSLQNIDEETLRQIFFDVHEAGVQKLLLMRLFPVGRGVWHDSIIPTPSQYRAAIAFLRELEREYGYPQVKVQCALKFFDNSNIVENPCDLVHESFGLMADGTLLSSPWAVGPTGRPLDDAWVLGNLATTPLRDILSTPKAAEYSRRLNENFGHCKIFSFINSTREKEFDRIFDNTDPLYTSLKSSEHEFSS